jgi:hypothetical protein
VGIEEFRGVEEIDPAVEAVDRHGSSVA